MQESASDPLLALIRERGLLDDLQLDEAMQEQARTGKPIGQILSDLGFVDMETQLQIMADHVGTEVINLNEVAFSAEPLPLLGTLFINTSE